MGHCDLPDLHAVAEELIEILERLQCAVSELKKPICGADQPTGAAG